MASVCKAVVVVMVFCRVNPGAGENTGQNRYRQGLLPEDVAETVSLSSCFPARVKYLNGYICTMMSVKRRKAGVWYLTLLTGSITVAGTVPDFHRIPNQAAHYLMSTAPPERVPESSKFSAG